MSEIAAAFQAGTFEQRLDWHVSRTPLLLDESGWAEINEMLAGVLERAMELRDQPVTTDEPIASSLVLMHFPRP